MSELLRTNTIVIEGGYEEPMANQPSRSNNRPPTESHQAKTDARSDAPFSKKRSRASRAALRTLKKKLGVYVSAAETERLTCSPQELRGQLAALTAEWEELTEQLEGF